MREINERLKLIRQNLGLSQQKLAEELGLQRNIVADVERGKVKNPNFKLLRKLEEKYNINPDWLLTGEGEMYKTQKGGINVAEKLENAVEINYLPEVYAAAGYGAVNEDYPIIEKMSCSLEFVSSILNIKNPYNGVDIIKVIGDSMEPFISNGEVVVIEKTHNAHNGDIVIANINGNVYVKRLEKDPFGKWVKLISENPEYETIKLEGEELNYMQIVGIVRSKIRPF